LGPLPPDDPSRRYRGPEGLAKALQALARRRTASYEGRSVGEAGSGSVPASDQT